MGREILTGIASSARPMLRALRSGVTGLALLLGLGLPCPALGQVSFAPAVSYPAGNAPQAVALGDFNRDGKLDLLVANSSTHTVSVRLGDGAGGFGPATDFPVGNNPVGGLLVADLNRDGKLDLVVATTVAFLQAFSVLLGDGAGGFGPPTFYAGAPHAIGDLNGDGKLDLVVIRSHPAGTFVFVRLGDGAGGFGPPTAVTAGAIIPFPFLIDLNGDAQLDLMWGGRVFLADGAGGFRPTTDFPAWDESWGPGPADLNRDGRLDLVVVNFSSNTVSVRLGDGAGGFGPPASFPTGAGPNGIAAADINRDGRLDLVVTNMLASTFSVLLGNGAGGFGPKADFATGAAPTALGLADLNRDGKLDLVVLNSGDNTVSVFINTSVVPPSGAFAAPLVTPHAGGSIALAVADLNRDGKPDLLVGKTSHTVSVLLGNGTGVLGPPTDFPADDLPVDLAVGDLNRDGTLDLVVANQGASTVSVRLGDGAGGFGPRTNFPTGHMPTATALADLNRDGTLDLVVANHADHTISVLLGDGAGGFGPRTDLPTGIFPQAVAVGDLNRDGKLDLVLLNLGDPLTVGDPDPSLSVFLGNGDGTFSGRTDLVGWPGPLGSTIGLADLNRDGKLDLVVGNRATNSIAVLFGNGDGTFGPSTDYPAGADPLVFALADLNGDGLPDLVLVNQPNQAVSVLFAEGAGGFGPPRDFPTGLAPGLVTLKLALGDLNRDGTMDLVVPNQFGDGAVLLNGPSRVILTAVTCTPPPPQPINTTIACTVTGTGGAPPYQAKWWLSPDNGATWFVVQDWGALSFLWGPTSPSPTALIGVWLRSAGNGADTFEDGGVVAFPITAPLVFTGLTCTPPSPEPVSTPITCTAGATGGAPPYQAKWWLSPDNGVTWFVVQDWGALSFLWGPTAPTAPTLIGVWLRSAGNGADMFEGGGAIPFVITGASLASLTADKPSPQPVFTLITFTATGSGGAPPYRFKWWLSTDGGATWFVVQDWGPGNTFTWGPTTANANTMIGVWLRSAGNPNDMFEGGGAIPFVITL